MVIVQGVYWLEPAQVEPFLEARRAVMQTSRDERGCLEYVLAADPVEPGRVILSERWSSREALDEHLANLAAGSPTPAIVPRRRELAAYEVSSTAPIG